MSIELEMKIVDLQDQLRNEHQRASRLINLIEHIKVLAEEDAIDEIRELLSEI